MISVITVIFDHLIYLALGRVLLGPRQREGYIFYTDWFISSASAYFLGWGIIGFSHMLTGFPAVDSFRHVVLGFIALLIADFIRFRSPRGTRSAILGIGRFVLDIRNSFRNTVIEIRIIRYMLMLLIIGYAYFIHRAINVPVHEYDVLAYHLPLAIDFFNEHSLVPLPERYWHFYFPANFEIWLSSWLFTGRTLTIAIAQLPSVFMVMLMSYALTRTMGGGRNRGWITAIVLAGAPIVMFQSVIPMTELFSLPFLTGAILYSIRYLEKRESIDAFWSGCALGLAIGTKYSFLILVPALPVAVAVGLLLKEKNRSGVINVWLRYVLISLISLIVVPFVWYLRNWILKGNPFYPLELEFFGLTIFPGIPAVFDPNYDLNFVPSKLHWLIYPWIEKGYSAAQGWGFLSGGIGVAALIIITIRDLWDKSRQNVAGFTGIFFLVTIALWWKITQHEPRFLIYLLPLFAFFASSVFLKWRLFDRWGVYFLLVIFAMTMGLSLAAAKIKYDIRFQEYRGNFMKFYGLPDTFDQWRVDETVLLFVDCTYGHLMVYPLTGESHKRRIFVAGLNEVNDEDQLAALMLEHKNVIPDEFDRVLYYSPNEDTRIDITKVINVKHIKTHRFNKRDSRFTFKLGPFSVSRDFEFMLNRDHRILEYEFIPDSIFTNHSEVNPEQQF